MTRMRPSERMRAIGIVQDDDPALREPARPFDLPGESDDARAVLERLSAFLDRVAAAHVFGKGMGLAAPQIGVGRAAAIVRPPDPGEKPMLLLNPQVVGQSKEVNERYEGCLSFFDVRGLVPRPLRIDVEHTGLDGRRRIVSFERGLARLVAHEIDHLWGRLYTDRMRPGTEPIPVDEYRDTGADWRY